MNTYKVLIGFNWWTKSEGKKRAAGDEFVEQRAEPGDTITKTQLSGADLKGLVSAGAIEKVKV